MQLTVVNAKAIDDKLHIAETTQLGISEKCGSVKCAQFHADICNTKHKECVLSLPTKQ